MENAIFAFSGHRTVPRESEEQLKTLLRRRIGDLASEGYTGCICGGAVGFDTLAAEALLASRSRFPALTLTLALPCPAHDRSWPENARKRFLAIREAADEIIEVSPEYHRFCMLQRNRFMVDHCGLLLCYLTGDKGGTAYTVRYALQRRVPVVNLALELD